MKPCDFRSGIRDSNPRLSAWEADESLGQTQPSQQIIRQSGDIGCRQWWVVAVVGWGPGWDGIEVE